MSGAGVDELFIKALTTQQLQRCFVIQIDVVEWIGHDLRHPDQASLHILDDAQMNGSEQQTTYT